jgi:diacylglycerol kinase (ATP)
MPDFDRITIIYNPISTGNSEELARSFLKSAKKIYPHAKTKLIPTKYMAHAEEIAEKEASKQGSLLLVSSSGDGGYHEVINGRMKAKRPLQNITCAVLPAGNANDHSRTMHEQPLTDGLASAKQISIDLLKVKIKESGEVKTRYAHSYIGLGFTPQVALELNKHRLNPIREAFLVVRTFKRFRPFKIRYRGRVRTLNNLVFSNINQMAKVLTLAHKNRPRDGRFEVIIMKHRSKVWLLYKLLVAMFSWIQPQKRTRRFAFITMQKMAMQLDGEIIKLPKNAKVTVTIAHKALKTLV